VYHGGGTIVNVQLGTATILGGSYEVTPFPEPYNLNFVLNCIDANYEAETASIIVKGGTFKDFNPSDNAAEGADTNFCAVGYESVEDPAGTWTVRVISSGGGGGGGSSPTQITVPVSSDIGSTNVTANVSDNTATVAVKDEDIEKVISEGVNTGSVTIDVSSLNDVSSAVIPSNVVNAINEKAADTGLTVALPTGNVGLDSTALAALAEAAGTADVTMSIQAVEPQTLSESQQAVLGDKIENALVIDVSIMANGNAISNFGGGSVSISVPYEPPEGVDTSTLVVWYLADDGTITPVEGAYNPVTKSFEFSTSHLSSYALVSFPFTDVVTGKWYYSFVAYAFNNNLFNGLSTTEFGPNETMTRAMLMTVLARNAKVDTAVASGVWYEKGMNWAKENGISDGSNPQDSITREQLATMLYRYAGSPQTSGNVSAFNDASKIDDYATTAMKWGVEMGLIQGMGDGKLAPLDTATRAEVAAILTRFTKI
jgi:hypothetical protein